MRLVADEDFNGRIVRGLLLRRPDLELVRSQDIGLSGASDEKLLEWATDNDRIVLTHDARTMPQHVREHVAGRNSHPGVFIVDDLAPIGDCIEDLLLIAECSTQGEWQNGIVHVPLR